MKRVEYQAMYIFMLLFLLMFSLNDIVTLTSSTNSLIITSIICLLIPIMFLNYHINNDKEELPKYFKYLVIIAATSNLLMQLLNSIIDVIIYYFGDEDLYLVWQERYLILIVFLISICILHFIKLEFKVVKVILKIFFIMTILSVVFMIINLFLTVDQPKFLIQAGFGKKYVMEIYMPLLFLPLIKFKAKELKSAMINIIIFYLIILLAIYSLTWILSTINPNSLFFNSNFIVFIKTNFSNQLGLVILLLNLSANIACALFIYIGINNHFKSNNDQENKNQLILKVSTGFLWFLLGMVFAWDSFSLINITHDFYIISQILLLLASATLGFYLGIKKYLNTMNKITLYVLSSFPFIYTLWYLNQLKSPIIRLIGEQIRNLNHIFLIFSVVVLLYYTVETFALWYAFNKLINVDDIEQTVLEQELYIYVLIPCMNEELVINNTLQSVCDNDYHNLRVKVIDDASEDKTVEEVLKINDKRCELLYRQHPNAQLGKGEALNWAFYQVIDEIDKRKIKHEDVLIAIIDADTAVETDYFTKVNYVFNAKRELTGLQSKVRVVDLETDSAQDLEFSEIINSAQSLRNLVGTVAFGGNGQFCRLSTLESLNEKPWNDSLVEDFDLSTRLYIKKGKEIFNLQLDDIYIMQTGIKNDDASLVKQRVRWAQGNVQSRKYIKQIIKSELLEPEQKIELVATLIKPWLMAIEYVILVYTLVLITDVLILDGFSRSIILIMFLFLLMSLYILTTNLIWSYLYNRQKDKKVKIKNILKDTYFLTIFLFKLTQIYPQSIIRYFKSENTWDKTKRQSKKD